MRDLHYIYILYSEKRDKYYVGQTSNVESRLRKHNQGYSKATKSGIPWKLRMVVELESKTDAIRAENWIKKMKSRRVINRLIDGEINLKEIVG